MAYKNVELPRGEKRAFKLPYYAVEREVSEFTIDEDKDYVLFKGTVDKDRPEEEPFYFYFKGEVIPMHMNCDEYVDEITVKWKIIDIDIPVSLNREEVLRELREAFTVYGAGGKSEEEQERDRKMFGFPYPNGFAVTDF